MHYDPFSAADRLEKADILTNNAVIAALQCDQGNAIRAMSHAKYKQMLKDLFTIYYHKLAEEAAEDFEQACKNYDAERDGIENNPRKKFKPKTEFEIDQELKAYFEEQDELQAKNDENQEAFANVKNQQINAILAKIEKDTRAENGHMVDTYEEYGMEFFHAELSVRRIFDYIATAMGFHHDQTLDKIAGYLRKNNISEEGALAMVKRSEALKAIDDKNHAFHEEYTELLNAFETGTWYSHDDIREIFEKLNNAKILCGSDRTTQTCTEVINRVFETTEMKMRQNGAPLPARGLLIVRRAVLPTLD